MKTLHQNNERLAVWVLLISLAPWVPAHDPGTPPHTELKRWSELSTWQQPGFNVATCNEETCACEPVVPVEGKSVTIPHGARVLLDVDTPVLNGVTVMGELIFEDKPGVGLSAHWIMIMGEHSALRIGSEEVPFENETHITVHGTDIRGNVSGEAAPWSSGTKFLMAMDGGTLALHGASREKTSWTKLSANAHVGDTTFGVEDTDTGWQVGDRLAVAPSGYHFTDGTDVTITAINGGTISFEPALHADHWGELQTYDGTIVDQRAPVGLLTRNIKIQGAEDSLMLRSDMSDFPGYGPYTYGLPMDLPLNFGVHVMIMGGLGGRPTAHAYVEGVEFTRSGQVSLQGRYSFHWHWVGDATGQYFRNNSIHHAFQRGVNVHRTSNTLVADNVTYKVNNHNYVWAEDGHETEFGNRFLRNLAIDVVNQKHEEYPMAFGDRGNYAYREGTGPDPSKQEEWRTSGFWGQNVINTLEDNHVAGVRAGMGYFFDIGGGNKFEPLLHHFRFHNNTAHTVSDTTSGLAIQNDLYPPTTVGSALFVKNRNVGELEFTGFNAFKNKLGVWLESNHHTIRDAVLTDNAGAVMLFQGRVKDSLIVGITENPIGRDAPLVRQRSPRTIHHLNATSSGIFIFNGQGGQKTIKAHNIRFFNTPGGGIRSSEGGAFHGSYLSGLQMDAQTLPLRMTGLGIGAFLDVDGIFDPQGYGRPTWLTFGDPHYITRHSEFDDTMDAWRTPAIKETIPRFEEVALAPFGPHHADFGVAEQGLAIDLIGNGGVALPVDYEVTPNTMIEFFAADNELHGKKNWNFVGVGLVNGLDNLDEPRLFGVHGNHLPPFPAQSKEVAQSYKRPSLGVAPPGAAYRIPIGQYYTGPASHLALYGRAAGNAGNKAIFRFHLFRIYEADTNNFRGWPVVREIYETLNPSVNGEIRFSDLFNDPRYPASPTTTVRLAPYYGDGYIHTYGNTDLHSRAIHRPRSSAAMIDRSYLTVNESGLYEFFIISKFTAVSLDLAPATNGPLQWTPVIHDDPGNGPTHNPRTLAGAVQLQAGKVYHWRHRAVNTFSAAPEPHTIHWRKPSMNEPKPFNITYLRPAPGPLAPDEPAVASVINDAIPDWWKLKHGIDNLSDNPKHLASGSLTDDGSTNLQKFLFGLDPFQPATYPVTQIDTTPLGDLQVTFPALSGRKYQLQSSTDLINWMPLGEIKTVDSARDFHWEIPANGTNRAFFRVVVRPKETFFTHSDGSGQGNVSGGAGSY
ncbi:MAG: G8 domain-containing protein [Verrucomicrobia bacterium]|nr:G8 domain-containing protein [Verrucomicrobiota bacterium]MCH8511196.1 G8 domain-containing protein [Kiritimatiellia bacterium]